MVDFDRLRPDWLRDPRLVIARRELAILRTEKTIVLALLIQLFIAAFSSFLVVGLVSLYDPGSVDGFQTEVGIAGDASDELLTVVSTQAGLVGREYPSRATAKEAFQRGDVDAVLLAEHDGGRIHVRALAPTANIRTTMVVVQLRDALRAFERQERLDRSEYLAHDVLAIPPETQSSPYFGFTYTVLIPLLLFLPVFISGSIAVDSVTEEFERGTLELLRVAPVTLSDIVDGKLIAAAGLAPIQAGLWIALLRANGTAVSHPVQLLALTAGLAVLVVSLGLAVGMFAPDRRAAQLLYSLGVMVLFGGAALLPRNPANTVARLAIDSADTTTSLVVVGYLVLGGVGYLALRLALSRGSVVD